ncbi:phage tail protein [Mesorhizobium sp.]|uniref:phage tail protein n=1 Tax=Mesorhizobium sp. TaxID=1871066 RepID=UPI000FE942E1|nr:phage tail protein [Mesorhizobium sp.]RWC58928.1 MAG: phage tail protein [Mesorhizobium sp.]RWC66540.1 MAG: phage tail protein [Mesorhizobium sp.]
MIFTAIAGAIGTLFGLGALATSLIGSALSYAVRLGITYLKRDKARKYSAVQGESQIGGSVPVSTLFGMGKNASPHRLFYAKYGGGNKYNAEVWRLAHGWCDGLEPYVYFGSKKHNLVEAAPIVGGNEIKHYHVEGFDAKISIRFYDGRPGQGPDVKLVADTSALGQTWKATSVCAGMTYVVVEVEYDEKLFPSGRPAIEWVMRGLREYDPRKDSTVVGGSGPQRIDNPATWVFTKNPAVHRLNYELGLKGMLSGRTLIGMGKTLGQLDLASYFASMNVADTLRNGNATYECGLFVNSDDDHTQILAEFEDAMAGYAVNRRGLSGVIAGAPQIPVLEITADDIPLDRPRPDTQYDKSAGDLYNQLSGQFTSIEKFWEAESLKPIIVNADIAADGAPRGTANDFLQVSDPDIAQYLLTIRYRQNRKGGTQTIPVSRRVGLKVQEGEWITLEGSEWLINKWQSDDKSRITLGLSETGADIYDDGDIEPGPIVIPPSPPINPSILTTVQNFRVEVGMIAGAGGQQVPTLRFAWDPPGDPTITAVPLDYVIGPDPAGQTIYHDQCLTPEAGFYETSKDVQPGVFYTARATIRTVPDRFKAFTGWLTTAQVTAPIQVYPPGLIDQINQSVDQGLYFVGQAARDLQNLLLRNTLATVEQDGRNVLDKQELRVDLVAHVQTFDAKYSDIVTVLASNIDAVSQRVTTTEARLTGIDGALNGYSGPSAVATAFTAQASAVSLIDGRVTATNNLLNNLTATVGNFSAGGQLRINTTATETGAVSTLAFSMSASGAGPTVQSALLMSATAGGQSIIGLIADLVYFRDASGNKEYPFAFSAGVMRANFANIGTITAGVIKSPDNRYINTVATGTQEWFD